MPMSTTDRMEALPPALKTAFAEAAWRIQKIDGATCPRTTYERAMWALGPVMGLVEEQCAATAALQHERDVLEGALKLRVPMESVAMRSLREAGNRLAEALVRATECLALHPDPYEFHQSYDSLSSYGMMNDALAHWRATAGEAK